jgi:glutamyl-tRNA synthetase
MSDVRVRFAPSPTGYLHIGGARTALFNWLYARHTGGTFVLRIEDTDAARNTPEAVAIIFKGLAWLGLNWDEGPQADGTSKGNYGPYFQSQRKDIYDRYLQRLLDEGKAYEDKGAIRFRLPKRIVTVPDLICGNPGFDLTNEPDITVRRPDGSYIFHFVNVVDDLEMKITHVIRGEDHLSNTPKHIALFEAFGATPPLYGHIPLILNTNGSKMSKRDTGASIGEYIDQGYLPQALRNYLCLLGWSPKDNTEVLPIEDVIAKFDLPQVNRGNARFDQDKLFWINGEYMTALPLEQLAVLTKDLLKKANVLPETYDEIYFLAALTIVREKIKQARELPVWMAHFFNENFAFDPEAVTKVFTPEGRKNLQALSVELAAAADFSALTVETHLKTLAKATGQKAGALVHPLRLALSGSSVGPSLYHLAEVLGKDRSLARVKRALTEYPV